MLRTWFNAHRDGHKRGSLAVCLAGIGLLVLASLFAANITPALDFVGEGEIGGAGSDLPNVTGFVKVWDLRHREPVTASHHRFRIENDEAFTVEYHVEFKQAILELSIEEDYLGWGSVASSGQTALQGWLYIHLENK